MISVNNIFIAVLFGIVAVVLFILKALHPLYGKDVGLTGAMVMASNCVTNTRQVQTTGYRGRVYYNTEYTTVCQSNLKYTIDGKEYTASNYTTSYRLPVGDRVQLYYDVKNPNLVNLSQPNKYNLWLFAALGAALVFTALHLKYGSYGDSTTTISL